MNTKNRRRKLFVEPRMQGLLVFKVMLYWLNGFLTIALLLAMWNIYTERPATSAELITNIWGNVWPAFVASLVLLPLIVMDCIRWSNRYAGPMVRLHKGLRQLANGQSVAPLNFRAGDLWSEMATDFNRVSARLSTNEPSAAVARETNADTEVEISDGELVHAG